MNAIETKGKKKINIDFAPMVDLGFLLITFFIFATELSKPKAFGLNIPDEGEGSVAIASATITLQMKDNGAIDYFEGLKEAPLQTGATHLYQQSALRKLLIDKRQRIIQQLNTDSNYTVIIHPSSATSYKEIIDVLDEMKINDIRKYILLDTEIAKQ